MFKLKLINFTLCTIYINFTLTSYRIVDIDQLKAAIRTVNDFPITGIAYRDITSLTGISLALLKILELLTIH